MMMIDMVFIVGDININIDIKVNIDIDIILTLILILKRYDKSYDMINDILYDKISW